MTGYGETALVRSLTFLAEQQASIANNLANVDTTAFKRRAAVAQDAGAGFHTLLDQQLRAIGYRERSDMSRGVLRETGNRFDVAIDGEAWFRVRRADGNEFYTRNGQLTIATDGYLTTRDGMRVLNREGNPVQIGTGDEAPGDLAISPNGLIADPLTGRNFGTLALVEVPEPEQLVPVGAGLFSDPTGQSTQPAAGNVRQGFLEGSNVDSLQELVAMITVERSFAATQRALTGMNRLQENLITNMLR